MMFYRVPIHSQLYHDLSRTLNDIAMTFLNLQVNKIVCFTLQVGPFY